MYGGDQGMSSELLHETWGLLQLVAAGGILGFLAHRTLDPGVHARGLPAALGLFGLYLAPFLVEAGWPWPMGPVVNGQPLLPALAVTLAITGLLKLISLGATVPRW
jgi:hypothetical protein